jgi:hypothetical protein
MGIDLVAVGNAHGEKGGDIDPERVASAPKIAFIVLKLVLSQELYELVFKRLHAMMLFLIRDVSLKLGNLRTPNRKRPLPVLPIEITKFIAFCLNP